MRYDAGNDPYISVPRHARNSRDLPSAGASVRELRLVVFMKNSALIGSVMLGFVMVACSGTRDEDAIAAERSALAAAVDQSQYATGPNACSAVHVTCGDGDQEPSYARSTSTSKAGDVEVHALGMYETRSDHGFDYHPRGHATITLTRKGRHALVLSAYEPTDFEIVVGPGSELVGVLVDGYSDHIVIAPSGVPVENRSGEASHRSACSFIWPGDTGGCDTPVFAGEAKQKFGALTDFAGCYTATAFEITDDAPGCAPAPPAEPAHTPEGEPSCVPVVR